MKKRSHEFPRNWLREIRSGLGISQERLAVQVGFDTHSPINKIENRKQHLTHALLLRLADALGCHLSEILCGPDDGNVQERRLIEAYRGLPEAQRQAMFQAVTALADALDTKRKQP